MMLIIKCTSQLQLYSSGSFTTFCILIHVAKAFVFWLGRQRLSSQATRATGGSVTHTRPEHLTKMSISQQQVVNLKLSMSHLHRVKTCQEPKMSRPFLIQQLLEEQQERKKSDGLKSHPAKMFLR